MNKLYNVIYNIIEDISKLKINYIINLTVILKFIKDLKMVNLTIRY